MKYFFLMVWTKIGRKHFQQHSSREVKKMNLSGFHHCADQLLDCKRKTIMCGKRPRSTLHQWRKIFAGNYSCRWNSLKTAKVKKNVFFKVVDLFVCLFVCQVMINKGPRRNADVLFLVSHTCVYASTQLYLCFQSSKRHTKHFHTTGDEPKIHQVFPANRTDNIHIIVCLCGKE